MTGVREDGYHLLAAEMVTVDLFDEIEIGAGDRLEVLEAITWTGSSTAVASPAESSWQPNLVERALRAAGRRAAVRLTKHIPAGAGLGGGSADAAAILRWAGNTELATAASLGADVPFCVIGGRALVSGIGEVVEPLGHVPTAYLLVVPPLHVSTPAVYDAWDSLGGPAGENGNDLEPAALMVQPRLGWWRDLIAGAAGQRPGLAGSGGTWWLTGERTWLEGVADVLRSAIVGSGESALVQVVASVPGT
ncbi:MAG TPA: 4-(cytidine 5'-diphospho)-2-C-methyl-D-erythritol kinase [Acidimicrobiales bacterium]|nr:4-(cytidine 5'-diphospho)-2-C-methyl-D-erythritol kinase [Acidimicrobiales bacterium]